jgi:hypothetical protein
MVVRRAQRNVQNLRGLSHRASQTHQPHHLALPRRQQTHPFRQVPSHIPVTSSSLVEQIHQFILNSRDVNHLGGKSNTEARYAQPPRVSRSADARSYAIRTWTAGCQITEPGAERAKHEHGRGTPNKVEHTPQEPRPQGTQLAQFASRLQRTRCTNCRFHVSHPFTVATTSVLNNSQETGCN